VAGRDAIRTWSIAFGLSVLIHASLAGVLSGQSWLVRDVHLPQLISLPVELVEPPPPEAPHPVPPPPRHTPAKALLQKLLPHPIETKPRIEPPPPPPPETVKHVDRVPDSPPAPSPPLVETSTAPAPSPPEAATASPALAPAASLPPMERDRNRNSGAGLALPASKTDAADASGPATSGSSGSSSTAVASVPRSGAGSSASTSSSGTVSGTSTRGITQWARPQGGYQVRPSYPASARRLGIQGTVRLKVQVLADGRVGDIVVESSAGHADLDRAASDAVRQWHFDPARKGTEPVVSWVLLPVQFQLR
jgi:protein TonB